MTVEFNCGRRSGQEVRRGAPRGEPHPRRAAARPRSRSRSARTSPGLVNIVQMALVSEDASYRELEEPAPRRLQDLHRDGARRAPRRALGRARARGAGRARPRAHARARRHARRRSTRRSGARTPTSPAAPSTSGSGATTCKTAAATPSLDEVAQHRGRRRRRRASCACATSPPWRGATPRSRLHSAATTASALSSSPPPRRTARTSSSVRDGIYSELDRLRDARCRASVQLERGFDQSTQRRRPAVTAGRGLRDRDRASCC